MKGAVGEARKQVRQPARSTVLHSTDYSVSPHCRSFYVAFRTFNCSSPFPCFLRYNAHGNFIFTVSGLLWIIPYSRGNLSFLLGHIILTHTFLKILSRFNFNRYSFNYNCISEEKTLVYHSFFIGASNSNQNLPKNLNVCRSSAALPHFQ